jgi:hypothetical protein
MARLADASATLSLTAVATIVTCLQADMQQASAGQIKAFMC